MLLFQNLTSHARTFPRNGFWWSSTRLICRVLSSKRLSSPSQSFQVNDFLWSLTPRIQRSPCRTSRANQANFRSTCRVVASEPHKQQELRPHDSSAGSAVLIVANQDDFNRDQAGRLCRQGQWATVHDKSVLRFSFLKNPRAEAHNLS